VTLYCGSAVSVYPAAGASPFISHSTTSLVAVFLMIRSALPSPL